MIGTDMIAFWMSESTNRGVCADGRLPPSIIAKVSANLVNW
jgi:hypothetical protein